MKEKRIRLDFKKANDLSNGKLLSEKEFDKNEKLIAETSYSYYSDDISKDWIYKYENGRLVEKKWNSDNSSAERFVYEYDEQGKLIKELWFNKPMIFGIGYEDGSPIIKNYIYNNLGQLIEKISDHRDVGFYDKWVFEYDNNNIIREIGYNNSGDIQYENRFEYDENNNVITKEVLIKGRVNNMFSFKYNDNNQKISMKEHRQMMTETKYEYKNDMLISEYIYEYGQNVPKYIIKIVRE